MPHSGPPANRPRDKRKSRERLNICTGERPATAQGRALAAAQGSALATVRNRLRTGRATSEQSRERLNNCTGERPATAQGSALAAAQGSALAITFRSAASSHCHGKRATAGRKRAATVPTPTCAWVSKTF